MKSKALFLLLTFVGIVCAAQAQLRISTDSRMDLTWNRISESWDKGSEDELLTMFEFNNDMSFFKHTTPTISSGYQIRDKYKMNDGNTAYDLVSDVGNHYVMIIDEAGENIRFIGTNKEDGSKFLVRHHIKRLWNE